MDPLPGVDAPPSTGARMAELDTVIGDAPAAVLVADLARGLVVHANDVARELAPGVDLPVTLDAWSRAARLRDHDGRELSDSDHPLGRVARSEPVPGQAVSAQRRSAMGEEREPLWVVGVPMVGAPMLEHHALVVFLPVREHRATAAVGSYADESARQGAQLRERAVLATGLSFTLADARDPELPLVWVNPAFTATSGYSFEEAVGHNCRFLQGPDTDRAEIDRVRTALRAGEAVSATLLNYRKDGLAFWNLVTITPVRDAAGEVSHFVGVQSDVSGRVEANRARDEALAAEQRARARAEDTQWRLSLMAEASQVLTGELDESEARSRILQLVVPALSGTGALLHLDDDGGAAETFLRPDGREPDLGPDEAVRLLDGATHRVLEGTDGHRLLAGLPGRSGVRDLLLLARGPAEAPFSAADVDLVLDLCRRSGLILDNLRLYTTQARIATTLQRSLLPRLPKLPWAEVDARYLPGSADAEVGGDFYDLFEHDDHSIGLAVGDVAGHDVYATAAMGQLKGILRATALHQRLSPAATLEQIDRLMVDLDPEPHIESRLASMVFAHLEPGPEEWAVTLSSAGHPPVLVRHPDGRAELLDPPEARGPLLGLSHQPEARTERTVRLPVGSVLLAYTDGLVERRRELIDVGFERLRLAVEGAPDDLSQLVDAALLASVDLVGELGTDPDARVRDRVDDDVVIIALRLHARD